MIFRLTRLKLAVERKHRCRANHTGSRIIVETLPDGSVWRGRVEVFALIGHGQTDRCYAWTEDRGTRSVCYTRLRTPPVKSAQTAVRAELTRRSIARTLPAH